MTLNSTLNGQQSELANTINYDALSQLNQNQVRPGQKYINLMLNSEHTIEDMYALKYNTETTSKKDIGDIYVDGIPWNIKSNNINKSNYSPNLISADKLFNHLINGKFLKFLFVDYVEPLYIINEQLVDAHHISWNCLDIRCQGRGVIQLSSKLIINRNQTVNEFLEGFKPAYSEYIHKERLKLNKLEQKFC